MKPKNVNQSKVYVWSEKNLRKKKNIVVVAGGLGYCWLNVKVRTQKITNSPIIIVL